MTRRTRTAVDRTVLGLGGLVLALAGSWLAATDRTLTDRLPSWWPPASAGSVLLDRDRLAHLRVEGWWTPTVTAAAIILTVLCAYGTLARFRSGRTRPITLPSPGGTVRPGALAEALSARVEALPAWPAAVAGSFPVPDGGWRSACGSGSNRAPPRKPSCPPSARWRRRPSGRRHRTRHTPGSG